MTVNTFTVTEDEKKVVLRCAQVAFNRVIAERLGEAHQGKGVYFRAALFIPTTQGLVLYQFLEQWVGGEKNRRNEQGYRANSAEKLLRLYNNQPNGHVSAFQSWEEGLNYPGALCAPVAIPQFGNTEGLMLALGASGLLPEADEGGCALTAGVMDGWMPWTVSCRQMLYALKLNSKMLYRKSPELS